MFTEINELREKVMFLMDCEVTPDECNELRNKAVDLTFELTKAEVENEQKLSELQARKVRIETAVKELSEVLNMASEGNLF